MGPRRLLSAAVVCCRLTKTYFESGGRGFESLRARQQNRDFPQATNRPGTRLRKVRGRAGDANYAPKRGPLPARYLDAQSARCARQRPRQWQRGALHAATWKTAAISHVAVAFRRIFGIAALSAAHSD